MTAETEGTVTRTAIDSARLARAIHLDVERMSNGAWVVSGGSRMHLVNAAATACDCSDHAMRGGPCKHALAVRLASGDAETVRALRALVPRPRGTDRRERGATA